MSNTTNVQASDPKPVDRDHANLYIVFSTAEAPASNNRRGSEDSKLVLQSITHPNGNTHTVVTTAAMKNGLREMLQKVFHDLQTEVKSTVSDADVAQARLLFIRSAFEQNRTRVLDDDKGLAVSFKAMPDPVRFADDDLDGYMTTDSGDGKALKVAGFDPRRASPLHCNMAVSMVPFQNDVLLGQSPNHVAGPGQSKPPYKNTPEAAVITKEVHYTAYQAAMNMRLADRLTVIERLRTRIFLKLLANLNGVGGGHSSSAYEMAPYSLIARLTPNLAQQFKGYGFTPADTFPELFTLKNGQPAGRLLEGDDLPAKEFWIAGNIVRTMPEELSAALKARGAHLFANPEKMLMAIADLAFGPSEIAL